MTSDQQHNHNDVSCNKTTNFTIEHILNCAGNSSSQSTTSQPNSSSVFQLPQTNVPPPCSSINVFNTCYQQTSEYNESFVTQNAELPFTWLQCTRYCPPKVPRKKEGPQKRQLGRHPRIPFTSHQLSVLEEKFKQSPYLSSEEVTRISRVLDLADIRVKIWFQNRRARERREKLIVLNSPTHNSP